jgi:hypothetical protein
MLGISTWSINLTANPQPQSPSVFQDRPPKWQFLPSRTAIVFIFACLF